MQVHQVGGYCGDSNIYLIIDDVIALVDAGTGRHFDRVRKNLQKFGLAPADIELIINTHCHFDHVGGNRAFALAGCGVAIHELEAELLRRGDGVITCAADFGERLWPNEVERELREGDKIRLGEATLEVLHTPGHTSGSICLYERELRALFSGDTIFKDGIGRTDLPTGDPRAMADSLRRLTKLSIEGLFPGHGQIERKNANEYLKTVLELLNPGHQSI